MYHTQPQTYFHRQHSHVGGIPPPEELAARIEEAKITARLLLQTIQSTPSSELLNNDLIKEFAERASSASRSIQGYMSSDHPAPDEDTMLTLIETNEQLSIAMTKHQRAVLQARKSLSAARPASTSVSQPQPLQNTYPLPTGPPERHSEHATDVAPIGPPPGAFNTFPGQEHVSPSPSTLPPIPARTGPSSPSGPVPTNAQYYGIRENPFADNNPQSYQTAITFSEPQKNERTNGYSLFDQPSRDENRQAGDLQRPLQPRLGYNDDKQRPQPTESYHTDDHVTPGFVDRQDSAASNWRPQEASPRPATPRQEQFTGGTTMVPLEYESERRLAN